jgi:hypothetical protein
VGVSSIILSLSNIEIATDAKEENWNKRFDHGLEVLANVKIFRKMNM